MTDSHFRTTHGAHDAHDPHDMQDTHNMQGTHDRHNMQRANDAHSTHEQHGEQTVALKLDGVHCTGCADSIEQALRATPHITGVHLDWAADTVHVTYHAGMITPE